MHSGEEEHDGACRILGGQLSETPPADWKNRVLKLQSLKCPCLLYDRPIFPSMRSTKKLIAKRPFTHCLPEFTSDFNQRQRLVDAIESTSLKTKI